MSAVEFMGFRRANGRVGIRNKILILPSVSCSSETARIIAEQVEGAVALQNHLGCGQIGEDAKMTIRTLVGLGSNPNVYGVVVVGLGCEVARPKTVAAEIAKTGKPVECLVIQKEGGTLNTILKGVRIASKMARDMSRENRVPCSLSDLILAVECGGSDPTSGIAANPGVGLACDRLVENGGTVILSETTELIGAEHILARRAVSPEVGQQLVRICRATEERAVAQGCNLLGSNPSPGNIEGGLSSLEEKSLGCVFKAGSSPLMEVLLYAAPPTQKGLVMMDTPGYDVDSVTGMAAGGAQVCVFTTGLGTPVGNPVIPVIKVTGNPETYEKMRDNIDINAGTILNGSATLAGIGNAIFEEVLLTANGSMTKAESFGFSEIGFWRCGTCV